MSGLPHPVTVVWQPRLLCARGWDCICKQLQIVWSRAIFSFLHISWSNRPGIIWNVQNRPWQLMSIRYGRGLRIFQLWIWNLTSPPVKVCAPAGLPVRRRLTIGRAGLPSSVCDTELHTELGSLVRPMVSAAADGRARWRTDFHRRRNIEVFDFFFFST